MASTMKGTGVFLAQFAGDAAPFDTLGGIAAKAARNLGLDTTVSFSGTLAFPYLNPWPQRPPGLIDEGFAELARGWRPILDAYEEQGVDIGFEIHPGEDLFDGVTYERFVEATGNHDRAGFNYDLSHFLLQQLDYLGLIDVYHDRICAFHVKDAEFNPTARQGVYSGYADWTDRAARFRSLVDGQVHFAGIFSRLCHYGYDSYSVLEWGCRLKSSEQGAAEGAPFIHRDIFEATDKAFDDFAGGETDTATIPNMLEVAS